MSLARMGATFQGAGDVFRSLDEAILTFEKAEANGGTDNFAVCFGHGTARAQRGRMYLHRAEATEKIVADAADPAKRKNVDLLATPEKIAEDIDKLRQSAVRDREQAKVDMDIAEDRLLKTHAINATFLETMEHLQALYMLKLDYVKAVEWGEKGMAQLGDDRDKTNLVLRRPDLSVEGLNKLREAVRKYDAQEANCRSLLALAYHRTGNDAEAVLDLDRVLTLDPERLEDYFNRGVARQGVKDFTGAAIDFETFLRKSTLPADSPLIRETWDRLRTCRQEAATRAASVPLR
jgi:tetratricopeptide (TPR) repeat protein